MISTCPLCEANCGIVVDVRDGRITSVRGDADDPMSRGYVCPKAAALADVHDDPDRIRVPMRRTGSRWEPIDWDTALSFAARRLAAVQHAHGRDAVGVYVGNPVGHNYAAMLAVPAFVAALGTRNLFTANSVDGSPRLLASWAIYGAPLVIPIPDLDRTEFLLILGANPVVSNGSQMTAPDCRRRLEAIRQRGGTIVVIDPRRTQTAALATRHHFIVPGTDALLLAAMITVIFTERLERPGRLAGSSDGLEPLRRALATFTPERVAATVGIDAPEIRALAIGFATARSAVCYGRLGTCTQEFGGLATWLVDALNAITGNLDRAGGAMFPSPAIDLADLSVRLSRLGVFGFDRHRSRVRGLPEVHGELPVATLADEIETPGRGQIRALVTHAGNPVLSAPNGARLERALGELEFMVAIDLYRNETTRNADLILPTTFALEHDHHPFVFHGLAVRNYAKHNPPVLVPPPGVRHDWQVLIELAGRVVAGRGAVGRVVGRTLAALARRERVPRQLLALLTALGPRRREVSDAALAQSPHGIDLGPLEPRLPGLLHGRRLDLAPAILLADLDRLERAIDRPAADLMLIGRRDLRSNNSWMHNSHRLVKGKPRCTLLVHPADAAARGVAAGDEVTLSSRVGAIRVAIELSDTVMRGVVSLPHGWGHRGDGSAQRIAAQRPGVSINDVTDELAVDALTGCAVLSGVPVRISRGGPR